MSTLRADTIANRLGTKSVPADTVVDGTAKAWVNFNGTGTVAIRSSFNVSSITDNGAGDYTVNFTNPLADASYVVAGTGSGSVTNMLPITPADSTTARTAALFRFVILPSNGGAGVDCAQVNAVVFR